MRSYVASDKEYEIRFALVSMLDFFINEDYIDQVLEILGQVRHEGYYVKNGGSLGSFHLLCEVSGKDRGIFEEKSAGRFYP